MALGHEPAFARFCDAVAGFVSGAGEAPRLTPRERELAALVAQGLDSAQLAARLCVAETVRNALSAPYAKLGVDGSARGCPVPGPGAVSARARDGLPGPWRGRTG